MVFFWVYGNGEMQLLSTERDEYEKSKADGFNEATYSEAHVEKKAAVISMFDFLKTLSEDDGYKEAISATKHFIDYTEEED